VPGHPQVLLVVGDHRISLLVGHKSTQMMETVHRQLRPVLAEGAEAMDGLLPQNPYDLVRE
jgi:hypothetical protein